MTTYTVLGTMTPTKAQQDQLSKLIRSAEIHNEDILGSEMREETLILITRASGLKVTYYIDTFGEFKITRGNQGPAN